METKSMLKPIESDEEVLDRFLKYPTFENRNWRPSMYNHVSLQRLALIEKRYPKLHWCYRNLVKIRSELWTRLDNIPKNSHNQNLYHPKVQYELRVKWTYRLSSKHTLSLFYGEPFFDLKDYNWWLRLIKALEEGKEFNEAPPERKWDLEKREERKQKKQNDRTKTMHGMGE